MVVVHPDVRAALAHIDAVSDRLLSHIETMRALVVEELSEDRDIAVKVDMDGQLVDLWLKPGILDRKPAREIARDITRLVTTAGQQAAAEVTDIFRAAHNFVRGGGTAPDDPGAARR